MYLIYLVIISLSGLMFTGSLILVFIQNYMKKMWFNRQRLRYRLFRGLALLNPPINFDICLSICPSEYKFGKIPAQISFLNLRSTLKITLFFLQEMVFTSFVVSLFSPSLFFRRLSLFAVVELKENIWFSYYFWFPWFKLLRF